MRDPVTDRLLTPQNTVLIIIDFQPVQIASVAAMDRRVLVHNIVAVARTAKLYGLPVVLSTVNAKINQPMIQQLSDVFPKIRPIDRTTINSWEDVEFAGAVKATGRKKLIMTAIWQCRVMSFGRRAPASIDNRINFVTFAKRIKRRKRQAGFGRR